MEKACEKVWYNCLTIIKDIVEWQHYKTWFEPIKPVELSEKILTILVPSQFFYEYIEEHYVNLLAKTLKRELGKDGRTNYITNLDAWKIEQILQVNKNTASKNTASEDGHLEPLDTFSSSTSETVDDLPF